MNILGYADMTPLVEKFAYEEYMQELAPNVPVNNDLQGDIAMWQVSKPNIEMNDYFVSRSGMAEPMRQSDWFQKMFAIPYRFKSLSFDGGDVSQLSQPGTVNTKADPEVFIAREVRNLNWLMGPYLDEYLVGQALLGSLTFKLGNATKSVSRPIDYEIPSGNKFTNAISWGGSPTTATPVADFDTAIDILGGYGVKPVTALMNNITAEKLTKTTEIQNYITAALSAGAASQTAGMRRLETEELPMIHGVKPKIVRSRYASAGQTEVMQNKVIADNKVIFITPWPAQPGDWIEFQAARLWFPNELQNGFVPAQGMASWRRTTDNPPGLTCFLRIARFPVIRMPWKIVILTVS